MQILSNEFFQAAQTFCILLSSKTDKISNRIVRMIVTGHYYTTGPSCSLRVHLGGLALDVFSITYELTEEYAILRALTELLAEKERSFV